MKVNVFGIGEPKLLEIVGDDSITADFVHAHKLKAIEENDKPGLLIHRLKNKDKAPKLNINGHLEGCRCIKCADLKYRDFINS